MSVSVTLGDDPQSLETVQKLAADFKRVSLKMTHIQVSL